MIDIADAPAAKRRLPRRALRNYLQMLALSNEELAHVDPVQMNLLVARSIPSLAHLNIGPYQSLADEYAEGVRKRMPNALKVFWKDPSRFDNDPNFLGLAVLVEHMDRSVGIKYKEEYSGKETAWFKDPSDLFLNGLMDTKRGTCASMPVLFVAVAWRLGWPLSLASIDDHWFCRYDDGRVTYNLEATHTGHGGYFTPSDEKYMRDWKLAAKAVSSGSDLRALKPREMLGVFVGLRARNMRDTLNFDVADRDYQLARSLYPTSRHLYTLAMEAAVEHSVALFEANEKGGPLGLAERIFTRMLLLGINPRSGCIREDMISVIDTTAYLKR